MSIEELRARAIIAGDLYHEGRIVRTECFRLEMDSMLGKDTGPIRYERNCEYAELIEDGWVPKRQKQNV